MLKGIFNSRATIPIAAALFLIGLASLIAVGTTFLVQYFHFMNSGHDVTVPVETITLDNLVPDTQYAIYHRVTGSHITENRPAVELPDTLLVSLIDASTNEPIETVNYSWFMRTSFFGLQSRRQAIREFIAPSSGTITLQVTGLEAETVFYVGRTHRVYNETQVPIFAAWAIASLLLILGSGILIIRRVAFTTPDLDLRPDRM
jgi:hypothetical protein